MVIFLFKTKNYFCCLSKNYQINFNKKNRERNTSSQIKKQLLKRYQKKVTKVTYIQQYSQIE